MFKLQTEYALRTLMYLARTGEQSSVGQIAGAYGISRDHLFKVVQQLVRFGFVVSRPGRNGGIRLGRDAGAMTCGEVVERFEGRNGLLPCVKDEQYVAQNPGCALRGALVRAEDAMYGALGRVTIADLIGNGADVSAAAAPRAASLTIRSHSPAGAFPAVSHPAHAEVAVAVGA